MTSACLETAGRKNMDIYESSENNGKCIIIITKKEGKLLIEGMELAAKANKRKRNLKKLSTLLSNELPVW